MVTEKSDSRVEISDHFSLLTCSNCIDNWIHFSSSCIHTLAASDIDIIGAVLKFIVLVSFEVLYIAIVYRRCCCASNGFDANKQHYIYIQLIHLW